MKKLNFFEKYETPYSWKESVRNGVAGKKEKPCPRGLVTVLQLGLAVIAVCAIGTFVLSGSFDSIADSSSQYTPHSGDLSTIVTDPNTNPDSSNTDSHNTPAAENMITGNVSLFRGNGYMIVRQGVEAYNIKVPDVVVDEDNTVVKLTDEIKGYIQQNNLEVRVTFNGPINTYKDGVLFPQIDNVYSIVVDLSQMPEDYTAPEVSHKYMLIENAFSAFCSSFDGKYNNAYSDVIFSDFLNPCNALDKELVGTIKNNTNLVLKQTTPIGVFADKYCRITSGTDATEYRYIMALSSKDGSDVYETFITMSSKNTIASNCDELEEAGIKLTNQYGEVKYFYYDTTPDTIYIVVCMSFDTTEELAADGVKKILANGTDLEFAIGRLNGIDITAIREGNSELFCLCEDSSACKHNKKVDADESNVLIAVQVTARE